MYRLLLAVLLLVPCFTTAQDIPGDKIHVEDTSHLKKALENSQRYLDSMRIARETSQGIDSFLQYQKEQKEKQRKRAMLYLGIGVFFFIVLIVGLRRRRSKK